MKTLTRVLCAFLFFASLAQATCMQTCNDTDAGDEPQLFGVTTLNTSCAAPGGPVHTTRSDFFEECSGGVLTEYFCDPHGFPGAQGVLKKLYSCRSCDPVHQGVCLDLGPSTEPSREVMPTQSCSNASRNQ